MMMFLCDLGAFLEARYDALQMIPAIAYVAKKELMLSLLPMATNLTAHSLALCPLMAWVIQRMQPL